MKTLGVVALVVLSLPMSARADIAPSGSVSVGANVGAHDHPDDSGASVGADLDGDLRFGMFTVGGSLGFDDYALMDGAPVHSNTVAGRAGLAVPVKETSRNAAGRFVRVSAIGSLEGGVHYYSPAGERKEFLGGTNTYHGDTRPRTFGGIRTGIELAIFRPQGTPAVVVRFEAVARHDMRSAELEYSRVSCGGLFSAEDECTDPSHGMTRVGGNELGVTTSIGLQFGGP